MGTQEKKLGPENIDVDIIISEATDKITRGDGFLSPSDLSEAGFG